MRRLVVGALIAAPFAVGVAVAAPGPDRDVVFTFAEQQINESSGLVAFDDFAVTVNDSGDSARVFVVDPETGETTSVVSYGGNAVDVEALAPAAAGERSVWVADIGDNSAKRTDLAIIRVPLDTGAETVTGDRYAVAWEDGPADAEAFLVHPVTGQMYAVTKAVIGGEILQGPTSLSPGDKNVFTAVAAAPALVTDGAFFPDGEHFILRNYGMAYVFETATLQQIGSIDLPKQGQGEGLAVTPDGEVWLSTEGINTDVLRVELPPDLAAAVGGLDAPSSPEAGESDTPAEDATDDPATDLPGTDDTAEEIDGPAVMPWVLGGLAAVVLFGVLIRSLRPH